MLAMIIYNHSMNNDIIYELDKKYEYFLLLSDLDMDQDMDVNAIIILFILITY
jgi:hypothetical protein